MEVSLPLTRNLGRSQHHDIAKCMLRKLPETLSSLEPKVLKKSQSTEYAGMPKSATHSWATLNRRLKDTMSLVHDFHSCLDISNTEVEELRKSKYLKRLADSRYLRTGLKTAVKNKDVDTGAQNSPVKIKRAPVHHKTLILK